MVFNSLNFWCLFPIIFIIYWVIPSRYNRIRNLFLLVVSYLFYMNWKPVFIIVLFSVTVITFCGARFLGEDKAVNKKKFVWLFTVLGLLSLLIFKYYNFLNSSVSSLLRSLHLSFSFPVLNWAIPVGISFFTFQAVGYLLDVYHKRIPVEKNLIDYMLFVGFFPQVISGPISTAKDLMPQIKNPHTFKYEQGRDGLKLLLWGMFIKLVVADRLGMFVDTVYGNYEHYSGNICCIASIFYTIQIYCDFAGYSLMAIGIAQTLGFNLINNFRQPYLAISITDFWKRWHISLTRWLTTHVYIGLGGNRCSKLRRYWNILMTFLVSGFWHGANWTFIFWGGLHGALQILEKILGLDPKGKFADSKVLHTLIPVRIIITFLLVNLAWIFFRMPTIEDAFKVIKKILVDRGTVDISTVYNGSAPVLILYVGCFVLILKDCISEYARGRLTIVKKPIFQWTFYLFLFVFMLVAGVLDGGQFIYVSF